MRVNNNMGLVTIIVPAHNYGHLISETLESVASQTYSNWECIIVDDGSQDNTKEVVHKFCQRDNRFSYYYQPSQGVSSARNKGIMYAKGEYIQFLDADDLLLPKKIEIHIKYFNQNNDVDIIYSDVRYFYNDDRTTLSYSFDMSNKEWMPKVSGKKHAVSCMIQDNFLPIHSPLSRKETIVKAGLFNSDIHHCEDWEFWFRCIVVCSNIKFVDSLEALSLIRVHKVSASQDNIGMNNGRRAIEEKMYYFAEYNKDIIYTMVRNDIRRNKAIDWLQSGYKIKGVVLFIKTLGKPSSGRYRLRDVIYWLMKH